jgi:hypothetical protein
MYIYLVGVYTKAPEYNFIKIMELKLINSGINKCQNQGEHRGNQERRCKPCKATEKVSTSTPHIEHGETDSMMEAGIPKSLKARRARDRYWCKALCQGL